MNHTIFMTDIKRVISVIHLRIIEIPQVPNIWSRLPECRYNFYYFQRPHKI